MKARVLAILAVGLLIAAKDGQGEAAKDRKMLEGTWTITSVVRSQNPLPAERLKEAKLTFHGEGYVQTLGDRTVEKGTFRLDPGKTPMTIDLTRRDGKSQETTTLGIYDVKDGVLRICGAKSGAARPAEFEAKDGTDHTLITLQQATP